MFCLHLLPWGRRKADQTCNRGSKLATTSVNPNNFCTYNFSLSHSFMIIPAKVMLARQQCSLKLPATQIKNWKHSPEPQEILWLTRMMFQVYSRKKVIVLTVEGKSTLIIYESQTKNEGAAMLQFQEQLRQPSCHLVANTSHCHNSASSFLPHLLLRYLFRAHME